MRVLAVASMIACFAGLFLAADVSAKGGGLKLAVKAIGGAGDVRIAVKGPSRRRVKVQERLADSWHEVLRGRPGRRGRLRGKATLTATSGEVKLRAKSRKVRADTADVDLGEPTEPDPDATGDPDGPFAPGSPVGFNNNAVSQGLATAEQSADLLAGVGADVDRVQINWERFERTPGAYDFALSDSIYAADLARGVRPLFILAYAPGWASLPAACDGVTSRCLAGPQPDAYDEFARAAAALATRYPEAAGIEVWNEPNLQHFWRPAANPEGYAELLRQSYAAIKAANPSMRVAGVSLAQQNADPGSIAAPDFLARAYNANAGGAMDALTVHTYAGGDPTGQRAVDDLAAIRATRDAYGSGAPLWVTETGASTTGTGALSEVEQAARLTLLENRLRAAPGVEMLLIHTLVEPPLGTATRETGFGVVRTDLSKKPAYCALALEWGGSASC